MYPYILNQLPLIPRPRESWWSLDAEKVIARGFSLETNEHLPKLSVESYKTRFYTIIYKHIKYKHTKYKHTSVR